MSKALLIIDVQNAMIAVDNPVYQASEKISHIQNLIQKAKNKHIPIIYVQHNEPGSEFEYGSDTWQIYEGIKPSIEDTIIHKMASDSFYQTELKDVLDKLAISELVIVGMQSDYCINATSIRAVNLGYQVTIIKDAHSTWPNDELSAEEIIASHHFAWSDQMTLMNENEYQF